MNPIECKWTLHWHGADRHELLDAIRPFGKDVFADACESMTRLDDDDPETIQLSLEVESLPEALKLLAATEGVSCCYGKHLHVHFTDDVTRANASLGTGDGFAPASASIGYAPRKWQDEKFTGALRAIHDAVETIRELNRVQ